MKEWDNKLGYTIETSGGEWDIWKPDADAGRPQYTANFYPRGEYYATKRGTGDTIPGAMMNAKVIEC